MRRLFFVLAALLSLPVWSQEWIKLDLGQNSRKTHIVNVTEFALSLGDKAGKHAPMRTEGRDTVTISIDGARWIDRINNLPDYMTDFYNNYCNLVKDALDGNENVLTNPTLATKDDSEDTYYMTIKNWNDNYRFTIPKDKVNDTGFIRDAASQALSDLANNAYTYGVIFVPYLFLSLSYDNPEAFWMGNVYSWDFISSGGYEARDTVVTVNYNLSIRYNLIDPTQDFDIRVSDYRTKESLAAGITEYKQAVISILSELPDSGYYEKVVYLNDWLTSHNSYCAAYGTDHMPDIALSPMSALKGSTGDTGPVCEGYARAFKVLCDSIGIPNILAIGRARSAKGGPQEDHMWNEVQMDNGLWYAVDVTWNDPVIPGSSDEAVSGIEDHKWLLVGSKTSINGLTFASSHPNAVNYKYEGYWDYDGETLIDEKEYIPTSVLTPRTEKVSAATVHDLTGRMIGKFSSVDQAVKNLSPGLYIINGKKLVVR